MRKFDVKVNGKSYEVEIEEIGAGYVPVVQQPVTTHAETASSVSAAPTAVQAAPKNVAAPGGETINAPLPGNILDVKVAAGDSVKSGQILMILEAMKMENEILAPHDGVIASVAVQKGATVGSGDVLASFK